MRGLAFTVETTKDVVVAAQLPIAAEVMAKMMPDEPTQIIEKSRANHRNWKGQEIMA